MIAHSVRFGQGAQTLRFVPIDRAGRPVRVTSATYVIVDIDEGEDSPDREIASGSAAISAVSTTLSVAGGVGTANPRALTLASGTDVTEGRQYLLSTAIGRNLVTVDSAVTTAIQLKNPPTIAFPSGAAFQAIELEATFPLAEANDEDALSDGRTYQVVWTYTLQGEQWVTGQIVHLVRYSGEAWIDEEWAIGGWPPLPTRIRGKCRISDGIACATADFIGELESANKRAESYRATMQGALAIRYRTIEHCLRWCNTDQDTETANLFQSRYEKIMVNLITGVPGTAINLDPVDDVQTSARIDGLFNKP